MSSPLPISEGQLLLLNPEAYVNLIEMFPFEAKSIDEIDAFRLPKDYKLLQVGPREAVLVCRNPPSIFEYNKQARTWSAVKLEMKKG